MTGGQIFITFAAVAAMVGVVFVVWRIRSARAMSPADRYRREFLNPRNRRGRNAGAAGAWGIGAGWFGSDGHNDGGGGGGCGGGGCGGGGN